MGIPKTKQVVLLMIHKKYSLFLIYCGVIIIYLTLPYKTTAYKGKLIIAHRGASGYLPEHTLESAVLAYAMRADFLELDVVMTRDGHLIVMHDLTLNATTNVEKVFPDRSGNNGQYHIMEFSLEEIKKLRVHERSNKKGTGRAFNQRFPYESLLFEVPTLEDMLQLVSGLNKSHGRVIGLYIEIKGAKIHRQYNLDPAKKLLDILERYNYRDSSDPVFIQSFDADTLKKLRYQYKTRLRLIQLVGENRWKLSDTDFTYLKSEKGLNEVSQYADGIGPWMKQLVTGVDFSGNIQITNLAKNARRKNLLIHPYTFRADRLPDYVSTFDELLDVFFNEVGVDGIFTDFPDLVVSFLERKSAN